MAERNYFDEKYASGSEVAASKNYFDEKYGADAIGRDFQDVTAAVEQTPLREPIVTVGQPEPIPQEQWDAALGSVFGAPVDTLGALAGPQIQRQLPVPMKQPAAPALSREQTYGGYLGVMAPEAAPTTLGQDLADTALAIREGARNVTASTLGLPVNWLNAVNQSTNILADDLAGLFGQGAKDIPMATQPAWVRGTQESLRAKNEADAREWASNLLLQQRGQLSAQEGFGDTLGYLAGNPGALADTAAQQVGQVLNVIPGAGAGVNIAAGALSAGAMNAQQVEEELRRRYPDMDEQEIARRAAEVFAESTLVNAVLPRAFEGASTIERSIGGALARGEGGLARQIGMGLRGEALQGAASEASDQAWQNVALGDPITQGLGQNAALGAVLEGPLGGLAGAGNWHGTREPRRKAGDTLRLEHNPGDIGLQPGPDETLGTLAAVPRGQPQPVAEPTLGDIVAGSRPAPAARPADVMAPKEDTADLDAMLLRNVPPEPAQPPASPVLNAQRIADVLGLSLAQDAPQTQQGAPQAPPAGADWRQALGEALGLSEAADADARWRRPEPTSADVEKTEVPAPATVTPPAGLKGDVEPAQAQPTTERPVQARAKRPPTRVEKSGKPMDLLRVIASTGLDRETWQKYAGIDPAEFLDKAGFNYIFRKRDKKTPKVPKGMTPSDLREFLQQDGYLPADIPGRPAEVDDNDAIDLFMRAFRGGEKIYSPDQAEQVARWREERQQDEDAYRAELEARAEADDFDTWLSASPDEGDATEAAGLYDLLAQAVDAGASEADIYDALHGGTTAAQQLIDRLENGDGDTGQREAGYREEGDLRGPEDAGAKRSAGETGADRRPAGLFPEPTAREEVEAERRRRDEQRDGKTGSGRTDMAAGDGELFAGDRPEQESLDATEQLSRDLGEQDARARGFPEAIGKVLGDQADRVEFVRDYDGLPENLRRGVLKRNADREDSGRQVRTAAVYDPKTQRVFVVTSVVKSADRAAWHALHEIAGHDGLRKLLGDKLDKALEIALQNPTVQDLANAVAAQRGIDMKTQAGRMLAAEEALAELAAAVGGNDFDAIARDYGVNVPEGMRASVKAAVENFLRRLRDRLNDLFGRDVFTDADVRALLEAAREASRGDGGDAETGAALDSTAPQSFADQVRERLAAGAQHGAPLEMGRTPAVLRMLGFSDLPLRMPPEVLFKLATGKNGQRPALTESQIARLPELIDEPAAVLMSGNRPDSVVVVTNAKDSDGSPVVATIAKDQSASGNPVLRINIVTSAYGKNDTNWFKREGAAGRALYADQEKALGRLVGSGDALFRASKQGGQGPVQGEGSNGALNLATEANNQGTGRTLRSPTDLRNFRAEQRGKRLEGLESTERRTPQDAEQEAEQRRNQAAGTLPVSRGTQGWNYDTSTWEGLAGSKRRARARLQDKMIAWRDVQQQIAEQVGQAIPDAQDVYRLENLMHGRVGEAIAQVEDQQVKPLLDAMKAAGVKPEALEEYLYARHAKERNEQIASINPNMPDGGSGMTNAEADAILAGADAATLEPLARRVDRITKANRRRLLDHGLITQEAFDAMEAQYKHYVPLRGKQTAETEIQQGSGGAGRGLDTRRQPVKQALGRGTGNRAQNILAEVIGDAQRSIILAEKARVGRAVMRLVLANPNPDLWQVEPVRTEQALDASGEVYERVVNDWSDPSIFAVRHKGQLYRVQINNEPLAKAMGMLGENGGLPSIRLLAAFNRYMSMMLTQYNPAFVPVNASRDAIFGLTGLSADHGEAVALDAAVHYRQAAAAAWQHARGKTGTGQWSTWAQEFAANGGKTGYVHMPSVEDLARKIGQKGVLGRIVPERAKAAGKFVGEAISNLNDGIENALRLSAYVSLRKRGWSAEKAAAYAKDFTVNFNRKGSDAAFWNSWFLFYNAAMQGSKRAVDVMRKPKTWAYLTAFSAVQVMATLAMMGMKDDEEDDSLWDKIPDHVKRRNLVIPLRDDTYLTVPMPYGFNVFPYLAGRTTQAVTSNDPKDPNNRAANVAADTFVAAVDGMFPVPIDDGALGLSPQALRIAQGVQGNRNEFGRQIRREDPYAKSDVPRASMGRPDTLEVFKMTSKGLNRLGGGDDFTPPPAGWLDVAPEDLEYITKQLTGGPGRLAVDAMKLSQKATDTSADDLAPRDVPIINRFVTSVDKQAAESSLFYARREVVDRALRRVRSSYKADGAEVAEAMLKSLPELKGAQFKRRKKDSDNGQAGSIIEVNGSPQIVAADEDINRGERGMVSSPKPMSLYAAYKAAEKANEARGDAVQSAYASAPASIVPTDATRARNARIRTEDRVRNAALDEFNRAWVRDVVGSTE